MLLLHIMGITTKNQSLSLAYFFIAGKHDEHYRWVMTQLRDVAEPLNQADHMVFVTDRELALMNAIGHIFPGLYNLLCFWNINKNVLKNLKKHFAKNESWEGFMGTCYGLCNTVTHLPFDELWKTIQTALPLAVTSYLEETWLLHKEKFVKV